MFGLLDLFGCVGFVPAALFHYVMFLIDNGWLLLRIGIGVWCWLLFIEEVLEVCGQSPREAHLPDNKGLGFMGYRGRIGIKILGSYKWLILLKDNISGLKLFEGVYSPLRTPKNPHTPYIHSTPTYNAPKEAYSVSCFYLPIIYCPVQRLHSIIYVTV